MQSEIRMNDLNKALGDISSIRRQMARSTEFRGYGPATLAATGVIAVVAAGVQALWLPDPGESYFGILEHLDLDRRPVGCLDWDTDVHAHAPHSFRHGG